MHCEKAWASPAPVNALYYSSTVLLVTSHSHIFPGILPGLSHVPGLLPAISGMWAPTAGKSNCHHTTRLLGESSHLPGPVPSLGKADCALHVAQYPEGEYLPWSKRGQKGGWGTPCLFSISAQNTLPKAEKPHLVSGGPLHVAMGLCRSASKLCRQGSTKPMFLVTHSSCCYSSFCFLHLRLWSSFQN